jgi:hypothetical protein
MRIIVNQVVVRSSVLELETLSGLLTNNERKIRGQANDRTVGIEQIR